MWNKITIWLKIAGERGCTLILSGKHQCISVAVLIAGIFMQAIFFSCCILFRDINGRTVLPLIRLSVRATPAQNSEMDFWNTRRATAGSNGNAPTGRRKRRNGRGKIPKTWIGYSNVQHNPEEPRECGAKEKAAIRPLRKWCDGGNGVRF
jgi:hypothetical protein